MTWLLVLLVLPIALAAFVYVARRRQWRLGGWTRLVARARSIEVRAGQRRSWVRVDRGQWCERCETSFWWVSPHPMVLSPREVVFVVCERCHRDMVLQERLELYADWWLARFKSAMVRLAGLSPEDQEVLRRKFQMEWPALRSQIEIGL